MCRKWGEFKYVGSTIPLNGDCGGEVKRARLILFKGVNFVYRSVEVDRSIRSYLF